MIIADTGFFFALGNRQDKFHQKATQCLQIIEEPIITTYSCNYRNELLTGRAL